MGFSASNTDSVCSFPLLRTIRIDGEFLLETRILQEVGGSQQVDEFHLLLVSVGPGESDQLIDGVVGHRGGLPVRRFDGTEYSLGIVGIRCHVTTSIGL